MKIVVSIPDPLFKKFDYVCAGGRIDAPEDGAHTRDELQHVHIAGLQLSSIRCQCEIGEEGDRRRVRSREDVGGEDLLRRPVEPSPFDASSRGRVRGPVEDRNLLGFDLFATVLRHGHCLLRQGRFLHGKQSDAQNGRYHCDFSRVHRDPPSRHHYFDRRSSVIFTSQLDPATHAPAVGLT
jgi:hypothetical protein